MMRALGGPGCRCPHSLPAIELAFLKRRALAPDMTGLARHLLGGLLRGRAATGAGGREGRALLRAGLAVAAAVDRAAEQGARGRELAYHNRHHFAEATSAMAWLCAGARGLGPGAAAAGVVAMLGHDLGHDGDSALDGRLEAAAAAAVRRIAARCGVSVAGRARLDAVIRGTRFDLLAGNARRALGPGPTGPVGQAGRTTALLCLMANEADALASLLPGLGTRLGVALAAERRARDDCSAALVASHAGRAGFLLSFRRFSPAARRLGLDGVRRRQLAAYAEAGRALGADGGALAGARALDGVGWAEAVRRLASVRQDPG